MNLTQKLANYKNVSKCSHLYSLQVWDDPQWQIREKSSLKWSTIFRKKSNFNFICQKLWILTPNLANSTNISECAHFHLNQVWDDSQWHISTKSCLEAEFLWKSKILIFTGQKWEIWNPKSETNSKNISKCEHFHTLQVWDDPQWQIERNRLLVKHNF